MPPENGSADFVGQLAAENRVIVLGGMAVIAHGLARKTIDSDIWLDPEGICEDWMRKLDLAMASFSEATYFALSAQRIIDRSDAINEINTFGVLRITGLDMPIDVFRKPNQCELEDFEEFWNRAESYPDGSRIPDPIDLMLTKLETGRQKDANDLAYLEAKIKEDYKTRLPACNKQEAETLCERFSDPKLLEFALKNPDSEVREFALAELAIFEAEGDPFSRDILERWNEGIR